MNKEKSKTFTKDVLQTAAFVGSALLCGIGSFETLRLISENKFPLVPDLSLFPSLDEKYINGVNAMGTILAGVCGMAISANKKFRERMDKLIFSNIPGRIIPGVLSAEMMGFGGLKFRDLYNNGRLLNIENFTTVTNYTTTFFGAALLGLTVFRDKSKPTTEQ